MCSSPGGNTLSEKEIDNAVLTEAWLSKPLIGTCWGQPCLGVSFQNQTADVHSYCSSKSISENLPWSCQNEKSLSKSTFFLKRHQHSLSLQLQSPSHFQHGQTNSGHCSSPSVSGLDTRFSNSPPWENYKSMGTKKK